MGFSLEALVAVPCCLSILVQLTGLAGPVATGVKATGRISAYAALRTEDYGSACRHHTIENSGTGIPVVETCPQKLVEILSLSRDLVELFRTDKQEGLP